MPGATHAAFPMLPRGWCSTRAVADGVTRLRYPRSAEEYERHKRILLASISTLPASPEGTNPPHAPSELHAWGGGATAGFSRTLVDVLEECDRTHLLAEPPLVRETSGFAFGSDDECIFPDDPPPPAPLSLDAQSPSHPLSSQHTNILRRATPTPTPRAATRSTELQSVPAAPSSKRRVHARARSLPKKAEARALSHVRDLAATVA